MSQMSGKGCIVEDKAASRGAKKRSADDALEEGAADGGTNKKIRGSDVRIKLRSLVRHMSTSHATFTTVSLAGEKSALG